MTHRLPPVPLTRNTAGSPLLRGASIALAALLSACGSDGATPVNDVDATDSDTSNDVEDLDVSADTNEDDAEADTDEDVQMDVAPSDTDSDPAFDDVGDDTVVPDVDDVDADTSDDVDATDVDLSDVDDASDDTTGDTDVDAEDDTDTDIDAEDDADASIECNYLDLGIFIVECVDTPTRIRRWSATNATDEECPPYYTVGIIPYDTYEEAIAGASCDDSCIWTQFQSVSLVYCDRRMGYIVWDAEGCDPLYEYSDGLYPSHEAYTEAHPCE